MRVRAMAVLISVVSTVAVSPAGPASAVPEPLPAAVRLAALGCDVGSTTQVDVARLRAAIVRFQSANRLDRTGRLGREARQVLRSGHAKRCDDRPVPRTSGTGRRIVLSQGQNWVWLVRKDGTVAAHGGMVDDDWLPRRTYVTGDQCGRPGRSPDRSDFTGRQSLRYFVRFADCTVGFHRIPIDRSSGKQIHPDWLVGTDEIDSAGCIRLPARLAKAVWRFTTSRTEVVVRG